MFARSAKICSIFYEEIGGKNPKMENWGEKMMTRVQFRGETAQPPLYSAGENMSKPTSIADPNSS